MWVIAAGLALVISVAGAPRSAHASGADTALVAGAGRVDLDVPAGTPLAGYGAMARRLLVPDLLGRYPHAFWFLPHTGERDRLAARALVLEGAGRRVVWVTVDLIAVDRALTSDLARRLGLTHSEHEALIVSPSHTHSGPGAFGTSAVMAFVALDREDDDVRERLLHAMAEAVHRAERVMRSARIGTLSVAGPPITSPRLSEPLDRELTVMKVAREDGRPIAVVWNFAIHGTMLGPRNLELSGDVMGVATRRVEAALGVPALFVNAAVGDVSPRGHGAPAMAAAAAELARAVEGTARAIAPRDPTPPSIARARVTLPAPRLNVRPCVGRWVPRAIRLPLGRVFPHDAELVAVRAGDTAWVTVPGELQSSLGARIKQAVRPGVAAPVVAGLSNDYLGYFVSRADWDRISYVTCVSLYGPAAGDAVAAAASGLLREVVGRTSSRSAARAAGAR